MKLLSKLFITFRSIISTDAITGQNAPMTIAPVDLFAKAAESKLFPLHVTGFKDFSET